MSDEFILGSILYAYLCGLSLFFFKKVAFWRPIFGKKFGRKNMGGGVVWGGKGRRINKTGYNVLPVLNMLNV